MFAVHTFIFHKLLLPKGLELTPKSVPENWLESRGFIEFQGLQIKKISFCIPVEIAVFNNINLESCMQQNETITLSCDNMPPAGRKELGEDVQMRRLEGKQF